MSEDREKNTVQFHGTCTYERFYNPDSGWGVFTVVTKDALPHVMDIAAEDSFGDIDDFQKTYVVTLAGHMPHLSIGCEYDIVAKPTFSSKYNVWQYAPEMVTAIKPFTPQGRMEYLKAFVNERLAGEILRVYPDFIDQIILGKEEEIDVKKVKGLGPQKFDKIRNSVIENFRYSGLIAMLQPHGITFAQIKTLMKGEKSPDELKAKLLKNPYLLTHLNGFGFKRTDDIALKLNSKLRTSSERTLAFVKWYLNGCAENDGNTRIHITQLFGKAQELIPECTEALRDLLDREKNGGVFLKTSDNDAYVGLNHLYKTETNIRDILKGLERIPFKYQDRITDELVEQSMEKTQAALGFRFTDEQIEAVKGMISHNVSFLTAPAGAGKSVLSRAVLDIYREIDCAIAAASLSAKAAQRIIEATGYHAKTIHRLLGVNPRTGGFVHNAQNPLTDDVIFIDEASMLDDELMADLVCAVNVGARIVFVGDRAQLPPIGAGCPFSDLMDIGDFATYTLTTVHRQAAKSGILSDANCIRQGKLPFSQIDPRTVRGELRDMIYLFRDNRELMQQIAVDRFIEAVERNGLDNVVLIVPRKSNCANSTAALNAAILDRLLPDRRYEVEHKGQTFRKGARVIQITNDYERGVVNGKMGIVTWVAPNAKSDEACLKVNFSLGNETKLVDYTRGDLSDLQLAYALTVHKTQGSQWDDVVCVIDVSHFALLSRELLYTGITRAKKRCMLIAEPNAFERCVRTQKARRKTWLSEKLDA